MTDTESSRDGSRDNADMSPMKGPDEHIREDFKVVLLKFEMVVYALSTTRINMCRSRTVAPRITLVLRIYRWTDDSRYQPSCLATSSSLLKPGYTTM